MPVLSSYRNQLINLLLTGFDMGATMALNGLNVSLVWSVVKSGYKNSLNTEYITMYSVLLKTGITIYLNTKVSYVINGRYFIIPNFCV